MTRSSTVPIPTSLFLLSRFLRGLDNFVKVFIAFLSSSMIGFGPTVFGYAGRLDRSVTIVLSLPFEDLGEIEIPFQDVALNFLHGNVALGTSQMLCSSIKGRSEVAGCFLPPSVQVSEAGSKGNLPEVLPNVLSTTLETPRQGLLPFWGRSLSSGVKAYPK